MKTVQFHDDARVELASEVLYYAAINPRLGMQLAVAIENAVSRVVQFPEIGSPYFHGTRRVFPEKFPFSVVYAEQGSEIYIVAIAPFKRKPGYWKSRL